MRKYLPSYPGCFVCGKNNRNGINLPLWIDTDDSMEVNSEFFAEDRFCGFEGITHGGIIGAIMDEAMWWASAIFIRGVVITSSMNIEYMRPFKSRLNYWVRAKAQRKQGRKVFVEACSGSGARIFAKTSGIYVLIRDSHLISSFSNITYEDRDGRQIPPEQRFDIENP